MSKRKNQKINCCQSPSDPIDYYLGVPSQFDPELRSQTVHLRLNSTLKGVIQKNVQALQLDFIQVPSAKTDIILRLFINDVYFFCPYLKVLRLVFDIENSSHSILEAVQSHFDLLNQFKMNQIQLQIYKTLINPKEKFDFYNSYLKRFKCINIKTKVSLKYDQGIITQNDINVLQRVQGIFHNGKTLLCTHVYENFLSKFYLIKSWTCHCLSLQGKQSTFWEYVDILYLNIYRIDFPFLIYLFLDKITFTSLEKVSQINAPHLQFISAKQSYIITMRPLSKLLSKNLKQLNLSNQQPYGDKNFIHDFLSLPEIDSSYLKHTNLQQRDKQQLTDWNQAVFAKTKIHEENQNKRKKTKLIVSLEKRFLQNEEQIP